MGGPAFTPVELLLLVPEWACGSPGWEHLEERDWVFFTTMLLAVPITASNIGALEIFVKQTNVRQTNAASYRPDKCAEGPRLNDLCASVRRG